MIYKILRALLSLTLLLSITSCGFGYSLSGVSIPDNIKTYQVDFFQNQAAYVEPGIERTFTLELQDLILNQSSLDLVNKNGDYVYQGEITRFYIAPMTATASNTASQNRVTIEVNLRFTNTKDDEASFEKKYSFFYDYAATTQLQGAALDTALEIIFDQITQDIFADTLAQW
ncbi:LptE family protein [Nonlabens ulvanivorans]|uniref:LptE family protein n=1 Tax=Nonlabens ulvanivorans TaxID=906888 RepID=UPI002942850C|nr:LptE family protein [Nonlabens ulvanivorans]WOI21883.1 LptE family protein [Nonlabens ulvanivorans]